MFKKIVGILLLLLLMMGLWNGEKTVAGNFGTSPFQDVPTNHWGYKEIVFITEQQYIEDSSNQLFQPNAYITRAEAVLTVAKALNVNKPSDYIPKFKDVQKNEDYYNALSQLTARNIIDDVQYFHPDQYISRAEFVKILAKAYDIRVDSKHKKTFQDVSSTYWAYEVIGSLADLGIVNGTSKTTFSPNQKVTKAQLATFLYRAIEFQEKVNQHEMIYDYLSKDYIETINDSKEWENEVIQLINEERKKYNLPILQKDEYLSQIAVIKAQDFIKRDYFQHLSPYYGQPWDLAALFDYRFSSFGENIAKNFYSPEDVVEAWLNSESHRANILFPKYTHVGIGIKITDDGTIYWVQMFASK